MTDESSSTVNQDTERTERHLNITLTLLMIIGIIQSIVLAIVMGALASDSGSWLLVIVIGMISFALTFALMVIVPFFAKKALRQKRLQLAFTHSVLVMIFMSFMFPINLAIGIWELALCIRLRKRYTADSASQFTS